jgi:apolipoprotein D and lipocalin family protein
MLQKVIIMSLFTFLLNACTFDDPNPPATVPKVDLERFMGDWYVISCIPTFLEKNIYNAVENYSLENDGTISVDFSFNKDSVDGERKSIKQKAFIHNEETNSEWRIQLFWPLKFPYLIIDLAEDYSWTVIAVPDRSHVWIMSRSLTIDSEVYSKILSNLKNDGFDLDKLEHITHQ